MGEPHAYSPASPASRVLLGHREGGTLVPCVKRAEKRLCVPLLPLGGEMLLCACGDLPDRRKPTDAGAAAGGEAPSGAHPPKLPLPPPALRSFLSTNSPKLVSPSGSRAAFGV